MDIVIEPGSYHCLNAGDVAMMQIAVERLSTFWPAASIHIVTSNPDLLRESCPKAVPIAAEARGAWLQSRDSVRARLLPGWLRRSAWDARRFAARISEADLLLVSGNGFFNDVWQLHAGSVLNVIDAAIAAGAPVAMMSLGIGPLKKEPLRERLRESFRKVDVIAVREGLEAPRLLESFGVDPDRIVVTGDDAIELAFRNGVGAQGSALGVNIRSAPYVGLDRGEIDSLSRALRSFAGGHPEVQLLPVVVSHHSEDGDAVDVTTFLEGHHRDPRTAEARIGYRSPEEVVGTIGGCRVVLATTYHAAVFAAAQGIPVVAASASDYYRPRFKGLNRLFGDGVRHVDLADEGLPALTAALEEMWDEGPGFRGPLQDAARAQIAESRRAYDRVKGLVQA